MNNKEKIGITGKKIKKGSKNSYEEELKNNIIDNKKNDDTTYVSSYKISKKRKRRKSISENSEMVTRNYDLSLFEVIIIIFITGILVSIASGVIVYNNYYNLSSNNTNIPTDEELVGDSPLETFENNYKYIVNSYVGEVDEDALIDAAIEAMYEELGDKYTFYMDENDANDLMEQVNGKYEGFGIQIMTSYDGQKYTSIVDKVFDNSPAKEAGLLVGDVLLELDGVTLSDKEPDYLPNIVKYGDKTTHTLKLLRNGEEKDVTLTRKLVYIESVTGEVIDGVGYIKIDTFSKTTVSQVKKYIDEFDSNIKSIVLDVRDNSGGTLDSVYQLSDLFVEKGKNIYQYKDRTNNVEIYKAQDGIYRKFDKIAILINENSASASEVLTLALKESANAKVVGVKSFGKGTVQETRRLTNGKTTKITIAYWMGPNGTSINETGIEPDVVVVDVTKQLNEAINLVK